MSNRIIYIDQERKKRNTAGVKAPDDIAQLCAMRGYDRFEIHNFPRNANMLYQKYWFITVCVKQWKKLLNMVWPEDVIIFQHPSYGKRVALKWVSKIRHEKKCKFIAVIHDLESLRGGIEGVIIANRKTNQIGDIELLKCFDAVICHNEHMRQYMIAQGFDPNKLICLNMFDYLCDCIMEDRKKFDIPSIAIAGNLAKGKSSYIYDICKDGRNQNLKVYLYGNNFDQESAVKQLEWCGSFKAEELPKYLTGDFGLVWDGKSVETCSGNTGEYLKYNNPHKTSLYLSAGMPVVVWRQAAISDFILRNGVGIAVDSLREIETCIRNISKEEYEEMCVNVRKISCKLREGYFFYTAIDKAIKICRCSV